MSLDDDSKFENLGSATGIAPFFNPFVLPMAFLLMNPFWRSALSSK